MIHKLSSTFSIVLNSGKKYAFVSPFFSYDPVFSISLPSEWVPGIWERLHKRAWKMGRMFLCSPKMSFGLFLSRFQEEQKRLTRNPLRNPLMYLCQLFEFCILHLWTSSLETSLYIYIYSVSHTVLCTLNKTRLHNLDSEIIHVELSLLSDFQ